MKKKQGKKKINISIDTKPKIDLNYGDFGGRHFSRTIKITFSEIDFVSHTLGLGAAVIKVNGAKCGFEQTLHAHQPAGMRSDERERKICRSRWKSEFFFSSSRQLVLTMASSLICYLLGHFSAQQMWFNVHEQIMNRTSKVARTKRNDAKCVVFASFVINQGKKTLWCMCAALRLCSPFSCYSLSFGGHCQCAHQVHSAAKRNVCIAAAVPVQR